MTESEWLTSGDPAKMLQDITKHADPSGRALRLRASDRKLRLFAVACCRQVWPLLTDKRSQHAVEVAELFADGATSIEDLEYAQDKAHDVWLEIPGDVTTNLQRSVAYDAYACADRDVTHPVNWHLSKAAQVSLLREIIGNPFRPVLLPKTWVPADRRAYAGGWRDTCEWLTPIVLSIASRIYDERDFAGMPILADALEDAGCTNEEILQHCRLDAGPHVRGCWMLDLLLGKE